MAGEEQGHDVSFRWDCGDEGCHEGGFAEAGECAPLGHVAVDAERLEPVGGAEQVVGDLVDEVGPVAPALGRGVRSASRY